jgi:hypothetical protein
MATNGFTKEGAARIEVRIASESDAVMLAGLRYELRSSLHEVVENEAAFVERCATWMEQRLRQESHWKCWIAETNQIPVGSVWAQLIEKIPNPIAEPECYVYLTNFYVREEYRGKGHRREVVVRSAGMEREQRCLYSNPLADRAKQTFLFATWILER